jgi:hypothetical protein
VKILFILKKKPDEAVNTIMAESSKESEVIVYDLQEKQDYDSLIELIEKCDRIITW